MSSQWRRRLGGGAAASVAAYVAVDFDLRESVDVAAAVPLTITVIATLILVWGIRELRRAPADSGPIWTATVVGLIGFAGSLPFALTAPYIDPLAGALITAGVLAGFAALLASAALAHHASSSGVLGTLFPGSNPVTLAFGAGLFAAGALVAPAVPGTPVRFKVTLSETAESEADVETTGASAGDDPNTGTPDEGSCSHGPGEGVSDEAIAEVMRLASEEQADPDYDCLEEATASGRGVWVQWFSSGAAVIIGSGGGAGVANGVWLDLFADLAEGAPTSDALKGQLVNRFDCGGSSADVQPVVDVLRRVVFMASRPAKFDAESQPAAPFATPSALMGAWEEHTRSGRALVATGPAYEDGGRLVQQFVDPVDAMQEPIILSGPLSPIMADPGLVSDAMTLDRLYAACSDGPLPESLRRAGGG